ncbi:MAG TPA: 3-hydroxyacyl-CoA dehydrogenase family protein [Solirubrobacterales bacterium]|jgi:3-hydroxybutyryl-CoA dehydrogenase|nr:3-hydroxyacyl-CoA dehydrogenase family protein [Solirubrobacterales bacterium]
MGHAVVIGGGTMGAGIASVLARAGLETELVEVSQELAEAGVQSAAEMINAGVARNRITAGDGAAAKARLTARTGIAGATPRPRLLIEAVPERIELKYEVLREAESLDPELLATNTSGISITDLSEPLADPSRFLGLHFFNPVPAMGLVEVVLGERTSEQAAQAAARLITEIGKESVVIGDSPGFASSRLGLVLGLEAIRMLESGVASAADIDKAMVLGYRHPVGPLRLTDIVGLDVRLDIAHNLEHAYGDRFKPPPLLEQMVAEGRLGKKVGRGFFEW